MTSIIKYSLKELETMVKDDKTCVTKKTVSQNIAFQPWCLANLKDSLEKIMNNKIGKYDKQLNGIILSYKNVKILDDVYAIHKDNSELFSDVEADFYVFQPHVGATLCGIVSKKSMTHLGVLVHKVFNVVIPTPPNQTSATWIGSKLNVGQQVEFKIVVLDLFGALPYIRGALDESFELPATDELESATVVDIEELNSTHVNFDGTKPKFIKKVNKSPEKKYDINNESKAEVKNILEITPKKKVKHKDCAPSDSDFVSDVDDVVLKEHEDLMKKIMLADKKKNKFTSNEVLTPSTPGLKKLHDDMNRGMKQKYSSPTLQDKVKDSVIIRNKKISLSEMSKNGDKISPNTSKSSKTSPVDNSSNSNSPIKLKTKKSSPTVNSCKKLSPILSKSLKLSPVYDLTSIDLSKSTNKNYCTPVSSAISTKKSKKKKLSLEDSLVENCDIINDGPSSSPSESTKKLKKKKLSLVNNLYEELPLKREKKRHSFDLHKLDGGLVTDKSKKESSKQLVNGQNETDAIDLCDSVNSRLSESVDEERKRYKLERKRLKQEMRNSLTAKDEFKTKSSPTTTKMKFTSSPIIDTIKSPSNIEITNHSIVNAKEIISSPSSSVICLTSKRKRKRKYSDSFQNESTESTDVCLTGEIPKAKKRKKDKSYVEDPNPADGFLDTASSFESCSSTTESAKVKKMNKKSKEKTHDSSINELDDSKRRNKSNADNSEDRMKKVQELLMELASDPSLLTDIQALIKSRRSQ